MGLKYSIITPFTSFIAIELRNEKTTTSMIQQKIPLKIPRPQTPKQQTQSTGRAKIKIGNHFSDNFACTIGIEFGVVSAKTKTEKKFPIEFWDTGT